MKRILLGVLMDVIATAAMLFFVVLPSVMPIDSVPGMRPILQGLLCERGETINVESHTYTRPGRVSTSANFYCVRESGAEREVTGKAIMIGIIGFVVPLLAGIFLIISGSASQKKKRYQTGVGAVLEGFGISIDDPSAFQVVTTDVIGRSSLTDRLKALKAAYDQGLITEAEYESKRKEILREM
jgi:hypothetical protein